MTLKFKIRVSKKTKEGDYSPIYVRLYDGAICDQTVKTRCMVQPHFWDQKGQCIKYRCLCPTGALVFPELEDLLAVLFAVPAVRAWRTGILAAMSRIDYNRPEPGLGALSSSIHT